MNQKNSNTLILLALPLLATSAQASADYKLDIGYTTLQAELGTAIPNGTGVKVTQVEAPTGTDTAGNPIFAPDPTVNVLSTKNFTYPGLSSAPSIYSAHATGVAMDFYGTNVGMASGIKDIQSYEVNQWINSLIITTGKNTGKATVFDSRIANHSWALFSTLTDSRALKYIDRQVDQNEYIQVAASGSQVMGNTYNAINVGLTSSTNGSHTANVYIAGSSTPDPAYVSDRAMTDLVAPSDNTSHATPIVSAAAALLVETGHQQTDLSLGSTNITGVGTIYNAERSESVKAILMAGADRQTSNTSVYGDIVDYRNAGHQTDNGLDDRYGAGQVNIYNSYQIMTAGEQNSLQDGGSNNGQIGLSGFDYDDHFGGASGSNDIAIYSFTTNTDETLAASLVWNFGVSNTSAMNTTLHHLELSLVDVTDAATVAFSDSIVDSTQNLFLSSLIAGHDYQLQISSLEGAIDWDYALAWNRTINAAPVPLPAAFWLFGSALASLMGFSRKRSAA